MSDHFFEPIMNNIVEHLKFNISGSVLFKLGFNSSPGFTTNNLKCVIVGEILLVIVSHGLFNLLTEIRKSFKTE